MHQSPQKLSPQKLLKQNQTQQSLFLKRFFNSKQFIFPQFDQQLINKKFYSLSQFTQNYQKNKNDFKSWILNHYPLSTFFKNIILYNRFEIIEKQQKEIENLYIKTIYIGEVQLKLKHGYGLEIRIISLRNSSQQSQQDNEKETKQINDQQIQYQAYQGFYVNNLRHGKGKLFSSLNKNSSYPIFYSGRFINNNPYDNKISLVIYKNNDFYIGKIKQNFQKSGNGILYISQKGSMYLKNKLKIDNSKKIEINLQMDYKKYQKVIISEWQENNIKNKNTKDESQNFMKSLLAETKIITHQQFYFGQAYVYYSIKNHCHISIKNGNGQIKYSNGDIYQGSFEQNHINGYGKYTWANQNYYIGQFYHGQKHGSGFWKNISTKDQYQGKYKNNLKQGQGQYRWGNGNVYNGEFKNDLRNGKGTMIWNTGQIFQGQWKDGLQNGNGTIYLLKDNIKAFVRQSQFINGIQMESGQNNQPKPLFLTKNKFHNNFQDGIKSSQRSENTSSFIQNERFSQSKPKIKKKNSVQSSSLPKINQKNESKLKKRKSKNKQKLKTQNLQIQQPQKQRKRTFSFFNNNRSLIKDQIHNLDYNQTQKLPYYKSSHSVSLQKHVNLLKTNQFVRSNPNFNFNKKINDNKDNNKSRQKQKNFIDINQVYDDLDQNKITVQNPFVLSKKNNKNQSLDKFEKEKNTTKNVFTDTMMLPIKWRNIKRKNNSMFQRK